MAQFMLIRSGGIISNSLTLNMHRRKKRTKKKQTNYMLQISKRTTYF